ncbi:MAG: cell division protease FtsH [Frankiales bacterium]|nr:cell division protease FtsH [Frankiales bacterium]
MARDGLFYGNRSGRFGSFGWVGAPPPPVSRNDSRAELADLGRMGRRLVRRFVSAARADEQPSPASVLAGHFGPGAAALPVVSDSWPPYEHVNVQKGLEGWLDADGRTHELIGLTGFQHRPFGLADLLGESPYGALGLGSVAMANQASGPGGQTYPCVQCGLYLVQDQAGPLAVLLRGSDSRGHQENVSIEIMAANADLAAQALVEVRAVALERNVFRGQVLSFGSQMFGPDQAPLVFERRSTLDRSALILPDQVLAAIEQQVIGVALHRQRLLDSGQHLKRGLLLHGAPGTGKTHTIRYLMSRLPEVTVVILTGEALHLVGAACAIARSLAPAIVVIEDVDLIAEDRGMHPGQHPMLFQLLNEMDGLAEDVDVTFILTTNRADLLEPALAARPGRVDQAVAFALPDADARRRLLELYRGNLTLELDDADPVIERTEGVTASFLKELLRKAALIAADQDPEGAGALTVTTSHLSAAVDILLDERNELTRLLLGATSD